MDTRTHREAAEEYLRQLAQEETDCEGEMDDLMAAWFDRTARVAQIHATLASYRP